MDLAPDELEQLLPLLTSDDCILDLHGSRVRDVVGALFDAAAQEPLLDAGALERGGDVTAAELARLRDWCRRMAGKPLVERLQLRLATEDDFARWQAVFWNLHRIDPGRAGDAAVRMLGRWPDRTADVARLLLLDRQEAVDLAREWSVADDRELSLYGNLLLVAAGRHVDTALPFALLRLQEAHDLQVHAATPVLLACQLPEARAFLRRCLREEGPAGFRPTLAFAQQLMRGGMREAFAALDAALVDPLHTRLFDGSGSGLPADARAIADQVGGWYGLDLGPSREDADALRRLLADARQRLQDDWRKIETGAAPALRPVHPALPWGCWRPPHDR